MTDTDSSVVTSDDRAAWLEAVRHLYYDEGLTQSEVASALGTTQKVVWRLMRTHGLPARPAIKRDQTGPKNSTWRGADAGYAQLHRRVEVARGKPSRCERCGTTEDRRYHWANLTGRYADVEDYARMCVPCHRGYDADRRRASGQPTGMPR